MRHRKRFYLWCGLLPFAAIGLIAAAYFANQGWLALLGFALAVCSGVLKSFAEAKDDRTNGFWPEDFPDGAPIHRAASSSPSPESRE